MQSPITKSKNRLVILFFLPIIAMLTYEYTFVLLPITILVILKSAKVTRIKERIYLILVTNVPVLAIGIYSLTVLRRERIIRTGTYEFNFDLGDYSHAVLSQMLAPIPHSQLIFGTANAFDLNILIQFLVFIV
jgi:energy-coupling factor transporter transmembrane protein EcfT